MWNGSGTALQLALRGLLAAAAALYVLGAIAVAIAVRAEPARAHAYARLAGLVKIAPALVGLACLGFVIDAIDLRPGLENDVLAKWPGLLPEIAALSAGAGFLTGLLAGTRPVWVALAAGGLMAALSVLFGAVAGWFLVAFWREDTAIVSELRRSAPPSFVPFFKYLALFPGVTIAAAAGSATLGRWLHALLGLPAAAHRGSESSVARPVDPAPAAEPALLVPASPVAASPSPVASSPETLPAGALSPIFLPRPETRTAGWPSRLLMALGVLMAIPSACGLLTQRSLLVTADPAGGVALSASPSDVTLTFSDELDPSSRLTVHRTVTLQETGGQQHNGGTRVADATGSSALSVDRRTLRVRLADRLPGGLYVVEWRTVRADGNDERFGDLYFGVRMPVPRSIRDGGAARERDPSGPDRRETLAGGILMILVGLAGRWYARELRGG